MGEKFKTCMGCVWNETETISRHKFHTAIQTHLPKIDTSKAKFANCELTLWTSVYMYKIENGNGECVKATTTRT